MCLERLGDACVSSQQCTLVRGHNGSKICNNTTFQIAECAVNSAIEWQCLKVLSRLPLQNRSHIGA